MKRKESSPLAFFTFYSLLFTFFHPSHLRHRFLTIQFGGLRRIPNILLRFHAVNNLAHAGDAGDRSQKPVRFNFVDRASQRDGALAVGHEVDVAGVGAAARDFAAIALIPASGSR